jgi:hypothetical protein
MVSAAAESLPPDEEAAPGSMPPVARGHPALDAVWAVDFMSDTLYRGRWFGTLSILDEGVRESWASEADMSWPSGASPRPFAWTWPRMYRRALPAVVGRAGD